jgi:acyl-[acyl-carrier-protein] desaturase
VAETLGKTEILNELDPTAELLLERHLGTTKEWYPHQHVPYSRARDFEPGYEWKSEDADLNGGKIDDAVRSSLIVNLLTEDNLPYYFRSIERMFRADGAWGTWGRRWTAEEGRHSMAIYGYLMATRAIDPVAYERDRMAQVSKGQTPEPSSEEGSDTTDAFIYLTLQELATRIAHRNTGERLRIVGDEAGYNTMMRVAADENLHYLFYRDLASKAIEHNPSAMVQAAARQVIGFEMPGAGITGFSEHAAKIARAGIYDLEIHHNRILDPVVIRHWRILELTGLTPAAAEAQEVLGARLAKSERVAGRIAAKKEAQLVSA